MLELPKGSVGDRRSGLHKAPISTPQPTLTKGETPVGPSLTESIDTRRPNMLVWLTSPVARILLGGSMSTFLRKMGEREWQAVLSSPIMVFLLHKLGLSDTLIMSSIIPLATFVLGKLYHKAKIAEGAPAGSDGLTPAVK